MSRRNSPTSSYAIGGRIVLLLLALSLGGCVLAPPGTRHEQRRLDAAGKPYRHPIERRVIPELPAQPTWRDVLHRAFLANGDLEAAYFEWRAAMARIPQVANYPNTNLAPSFSYMFSGERMKSWNRTTLNVGFDPMENLSFPIKVAQAGKVALQKTRAAGKRFEATKFELQRRTLTAYFELVLHEEKIRIQAESVGLLKRITETATDRLRAGGNQTDMLRAQTQYRLAENELANMRSEHMALRAMLNAMMAREPNAQLELPQRLPEPRTVAADDAQLIATAVDANPELARLAHDVAGKADALELARMGFIPDINPFAAFTGSVSQTIGAMLIIPTTIPEIRGKIDEARAMLRSSQATLRQARLDRVASFVAALYVMRNSERQAAFLEKQILPQMKQIVEGVRQAYATGTGTYADLIDSQRTLLEVRLLLAEQRIEREKRLVELEALAGTDVEAIAVPATVPSTQPHNVGHHE